MRPGILPEHGFKHKGNHYASLPWFGTKIGTKVRHKGIKVLRFSSRRETPRFHVLYFRHRRTTLCIRGLRESMRVMNKVLKIAHLNHISI